MKVRISSILVGALVLLAVVGLIEQDSEEHETIAVEQISRAGPITFDNVSVEAGLSGHRGNFFSWGDYDNDGYQDLLVDGKSLFRNRGPPSYSFNDMTLQAGINAPVNSGVFGDYDNDGWLDIFCGGGRGSNDHPEYPDILWHNERDGTFKKITGTDDVPNDTFPTVASGWGDMDRDGWIDLYMANYEDGSFEGYPDNFWMNNGDGTFRNSTEDSGMSEYSQPYQGRGVSWCDFDNDGFQDVYISNYRIMPNYLYRNDGNGMMRDVAPELGVEGHGNLHPVSRDGPYYGHSLGSSWGDLDNDGDMDLWVTNLAHKDIYRGPICDDSYLFENLGPDGDYAFRDVRGSSGIPVKPLGGSVTEGDELMVSSGMADFDNDGDLDLFLPQIYGDVSYASSFLYSNIGDMRFEDVSSSSGIRVWNTYGSAWCDYNNDGWIDLVTGGGSWNSTASATDNYMIHLYRNNGEGVAPEREWLEVELHGRESNSEGIGSRITVEVDSDGDDEVDITMMREVQAGTAAHGQQDSLIQHFGLGDSPSRINVIVDWSRGRTVRLEDVEPSTVIELYEPTDPIPVLLNITQANYENEKLDISLSITNNGDFSINMMDLAFALEYPSGTDEVMVLKMEGPDALSTLTEDLNIASRSSGPPSSVQVRVTRSFPPISNEPIDEFNLKDTEGLPPVAVLKTPENAEVMEEVVIDATGSFDEDGKIVSYSFDFGDGTDTGWTTSSRVEHTYAYEGNYTITLEVQDDSGSISMQPAISVISIIIPEVADPVARIISIDPEEVEEGDEIDFEGEGIPSGERTIREYEWRSDRDGILSRRSSFTEDDLTLGDHIISFSVKDSSGIWSEPAIGKVTVIGEVIPDTWVKISDLPADVLRGIVMIKGTAGPYGQVENVEVRIDSSPWRTAFGSDEWEFTLDTKDLDNSVPHSLQVRAYANDRSSQIISITFKVNNTVEETVSPHASKEGSGPLDDEVIIALVISVPLLILGVLIFIFLVKPGKRKKEEYTIPIQER